MTDVKDIGELKREPPKNTVRARIRNNEEKSLLLKKDANSRASGMFEWPGGNINEGENPTEAIVREVNMETGLLLNDGDFIESGSFLYDIPMPEKRIIASRVVNQYSVRILTDGTEVVVGTHDEDKHSGFKWVTDEELEKLQEDGKLLGNTRLF